MPPPNPRDYRAVTSSSLLHTNMFWFNCPQVVSLCLHDASFLDFPPCAVERDAPGCGGRVSVPLGPGSGQVRAPDSFGHAQHLLIKEVGSLPSLTPGPFSFRCEHGILCILRHLIRASRQYAPTEGRRWWQTARAGTLWTAGPPAPPCPLRYPCRPPPKRFYCCFFIFLFCPLTQFCFPVSYFGCFVPTLSSAAAGRHNITTARRLICQGAEKLAVFFLRRTPNMCWIRVKSTLLMVICTIAIAADGDLILSSSM